MKDLFVCPDCGAIYERETLSYKIMIRTVNKAREAVGGSKLRDICSCCYHMEEEEPS